MADDDNIRYINSLIPDRDPNLEYGSILPFAVDRTTDETYFAYPEFVRDLVSVFETPARVARGEIQDMDELRQAAADLALTYTPAGGLAGIATGTRGLAMGAARSEKPVIDKEGLSGVFYRGSSNLDELAGKYSLPKEGVLGGGGVYVTQKPDYASNYAVQTALGEPKAGGFVAPLNVKFDNPLIIDIKTAQEKVAPELKVLKALGLSDDKAADMLESAYEKTGGLTNQISSRAKKQGFDGIVLRNEDGTIQEAISYNTQNIRSAFEEVIKNPDKDLKKYRSGGSIERNPYKHEPKAI